MVDLVSGVLDYSGAIDLPQYYVKNLKMDQFRTNNDMNEAAFGVKVEIVLGQRLLNQLLTTFMPTTFICLVAISTNFFRVSSLSDHWCHCGSGANSSSERPLNGATDKRPYRCGRYVTVITVSI